MASAPIFSQEKATSPAQKGSALKQRRKGRDEGVSSSVKALQNEEASQNEMAFASLGTSESLPPLSPANEDEDRAKKARNARYSLLRELSRNIWNTKLPLHSARHCSRRAIPSERRLPDGSIIATKMPGTIQR